MKKDMNPSIEPITEGQIGKLNELIRARLLKSSSQFQKDPFQDVLEHQGEELINEIITVIIKKVDAVSGMIIRHVSVNRKRSPKEMFDATGRSKYVDDDVVVDIPRGEGEETDVIFFKLDYSPSDDNLEKEYEIRGLKPADTYSQAAVNEADLAFADTHPNGTHWKDKNGKWCFAAFEQWIDGWRLVLVNRSDGDWTDRWWFAGLRK